MVQYFRMPEHVEPVWQRVDDYFERQLVREDDVLRHMPERNADAGLPPIAVSASQGKLVHLLIRAMNAKRVIEVGTLGGYSGVWIAKALPSNGQLITLELNAAFAAVAKKNFDMAGVSSRVHVRVGPAIDELQRLASTEPRSFDLVFIDAAKPSNPHYFRLAMQLVRAGGVIVVDNVVREGEVADDASTDARVRGTRDMMQLIHETRGVTATALQTVGAKGYDGFLMAIVD
jgi:predicted O-methyltransferase YrrM